MKLRMLVLCLLGLVSLVGPAHSTSTPCRRGCLQHLLDQYYRSLAARNPRLLPTAAGVRFTENAVALSYGQGLWTREVSDQLPYRLDAEDVEGQAAASNAVIIENGRKAILFVRLKVLNRRVSEVETSLVRPGEGQRTLPDELTGTPASYVTPVPAAARSTRQELIADAQAYFMGLKTAGQSDYQSPPLATDVFRVENGVHTSRPAAGAPASQSMDQMLRRGFGTDKLFVSEQRFPVVDAERGVVVAIGLMHVKYGPRPPASPDKPVVSYHVLTTDNRKQMLVEFFKVENHLITEIQATMLDLNDPAVSSLNWPSADSPASESPKL